ncbi:hypothetical protein ACI792_03990 [Blastococcus sp. SYSU DS0669]
MTDPTAVDRRTGAAALIAGVLMFVSVATELIWNVQRPDGSVSDVPVYVLFLGGFALGTVALAVAVHGLGRGRTGAALSRAGRIGRSISLTGAGLLTVFAVVHLGTGLATGTPLEASFWAFFLGFLLLIAGAVPLALGLRRSPVVGAWWVTVLVAGIAAAVAMSAQAPLHEIGLFTFDAAWAALGLRLLSGHPATVSEGVRTHA